MAKDKIHDQVRRALEHDHWTITREQFRRAISGRAVVIDILAERDLIVADGPSGKIAVEVKTFGGKLIEALKEAVGTYVVYRSVLSRLAPERTLYLAVDEDTAYGFLQETMPQFILIDAAVKLVVVDIRSERIIEWRA